ncbi:MAG: hypothetical protein IKE70_06540 [Bacilli bacterium]|nr:hypothetical protein [Bacilli bacterium]
MKIKKIIFLISILILITPSFSYALEKTEIVYSTLDFQGSLKTNKVHVTLKNLEKGDIFDTSLLNDIKNIQGNEKFSRESEKIIWKSTGKDIIYSGMIEKELPIEIKPIYYLNEKEVSLNDLKGKKGSVKILFQFNNLKYHSNLDMYDPFVVSMFMIPKGDLSNISISHGKVLTNGKQTLITSIATPGLYRSLGFEELKDMDSIILSFNTKKFENQEVYFIETPKLLSSIDLSKFQKIENLSSSLNTLQNGINRLEDGSNQLYDGATRLREGANQLQKGLEDAYQGSLKIQNGLSLVEEGSKKISSLSTLMDTLYQKYLENNRLLESILSGDVKNQLEGKISVAEEEKKGLEEKLIQVKSGISMFLEKEKISPLTEEETLQLNTLKENELALENGILQYEDGISTAYKTLNELSYAPSKIMGANEVISSVLMGVLGVNDMNSIEYTLPKYKEELNSFTNGITSLSEGSRDLSNGLNTLSQGGIQLENGASSLEEGSNTLRKGIHQFNVEGIGTLNNYGNKIKEYSNQAKTLVQLSKNYRGFSSDNSDQTIFVSKLNIQ